LFLFIAIVFYTITAFNSHGFYQGDAHYQIIEFANLKLGVNGVEDMPWEYHEQIRSSLQPSIAYVFLKIFGLLHIQNPYDIAFLFRLLSSGVYVWVVHYFIKQTRSEFKSKRYIKYYYFTSFFLYFIPYLSLQFSSENWSGMFFLLGLAHYFNPKENDVKPILIGFVLGMSFLFRFQIAFGILVFFTWLLLVKKESYIFLGKLIIGLVATASLGVLLDCWYYGEFVLTSLDYFYLGIDISKISDFGVSPWNFYYYEIVDKSLYKLGFSIVIGCLIAVFIKPKSVFIWIVLSFVLFHSLIPHKELRFIFPIVSLLPIILVFSIEWWCGLFEKYRWINRMNKWILWVLATIHFMLLIGYSQYNENGLVNGITKFVYEEYGGKQIQFNYYGDYYSREFCKEDYLPMNFYFGENIKFKKLESLEDLENSLVKTKTVNLFLIDERSLDAESKAKLRTLQYQLVKQGKPEWLASFSRYKNKGATTNSLLFALLED